MANVILKKLSVNDGQDIYDMLQTMPKDENGYINNAFGKSYEDYKEWLVKKEEEAMQEGIVDGWKVPSITYWLYVDGNPVGEGNIRLFLTDALRKAGGNIGYAIAPQYRGKGYAKLLLKLLAEESARLGMDKVLLTIHSDNIQSVCVAKANGGVIESEENDRLYVWISTS